MSSPSELMSFLHLDVLSNYLIEETKDFEKEFEIKTEFVDEQEKIGFKNKKDIAFIEQCVESMKNCVLQTELELDEFETSLAQAQKLILHSEATNNICSQNTQNVYVVTNNYMDLLMRLLSADRSAAKCNCFRAEIDQYNNEVTKLMSTPKLISQIMDCHLKALDVLDQQAKQLETMANKVDKKYAQITDKLGIGSLNPICECEMAKAMLNDKTQICECLKRKLNKHNMHYNRL